MCRKNPSFGTDIDEMFSRWWYRFEEGDACWNSKCVFNDLEHDDLRSRIANGTGNVNDDCTESEGKSELALAHDSLHNKDKSHQSKKTVDKRQRRNDDPSKLVFGNSLPWKVFIIYDESINAEGLNIWLALCPSWYNQCLQHNWFIAFVGHLLTINFC